MIDPLIIRTLFGALGIGVVGGTAIVGSIVFNRNGKRTEAPITKEEEPVSVKTPKKKTFSVSSLLSKHKDRRLLIRGNKDGSDPDGKEAGKRYKEENNFEDGSNPLGIIDFISKKSEENAPLEFLNACDKASTSPVSGLLDESYLNVFVGCTKKLNSY